MDLHSSRTALGNIANASVGQESQRAPYCWQRRPMQCSASLPPPRPKRRTVPNSKWRQLKSTRSAVTDGRARRPHRLADGGTVSATSPSSRRSLPPIEKRHACSRYAMALSRSRANLRTARGWRIAAAEIIEHRPRILSEDSAEGDQSFLREADQDSGRKPIRRRSEVPAPLR